MIQLFHLGARFLQPALATFAANRPDVQPRAVVACSSRFRLRRSAAGHDRVTVRDFFTECLPSHGALCTYHHYCLNGLNQYGRGPGMAMPLCRATFTVGYLHGSAGLGNFSVVCMPAMAVNADCCWNGTPTQTAVGPHLVTVLVGLPGPPSPWSVCPGLPARAPSP